MAKSNRSISKDDEFEVVETVSDYDILEDAPSEYETPTGLPSLNEPTGPSGPDFSEFSAGLQNLPAIPRITAPEVSALVSPTLKYGGAMAGAVAALPAAAASGPFAPAVEAAAGAGGYAIGASLADQFDQFIGQKEQPKDAAEVGGKTLENIREGIQQEMMGRIAGGTVEAGLNATATGLARLATHGPEKLAELSQAAAKIGINLTPAEILGTKWMGALEGLLDNLPWTSGIIQRYRLGEMEKLTNLRNKLIAENGSSDTIETLGIDIKNMVDKYVQKIGSFAKESTEAVKDRLLNKVGSYSSYADLDSAGKQVAQVYKAELDRKVGDAYSEVAERIPATAIKPKNTIVRAEEILAEQERLAVKNPDLIKAVKFFLKDEQPVPAEILTAYNSGRLSPQDRLVIEQEYPQIRNPESVKTYSDLSENVKAFNLKKAAQITESGGASQMSLAGKKWDEMVDAMHMDMDEIANASGNGELKEAHQVANGLYKKKLAYLEDPAFLKINENTPGAVTKSILMSRNPELIQRYRAIAGENLFDKAKDRLTNDILGISPEADIVGPVSGDIGQEIVKAGDKIRKNILKLGESATEIYSKQELEYFRTVANAFDTTGGATNDLLSNPYIKKMMKAETMPEQMAKSIVQPNNTGAAPAIEQTFGAAAKKKVADAFLPQLLSANQEGSFLPQTFANQFDEYGYETIKSWYGKDLADQLKDIAMVGRTMSAGEKAVGRASAPARSLIGFYEGTRVLEKGIDLFATGFSKPAVISLGKEAFMLLGSRQLAKLYVSPAGKKLFIEGLIAPAQSREAAQIAAKIASIVGNEIQKSRQGQ